MQIMQVQVEEKEEKILVPNKSNTDAKEIKQNVNEIKTNQQQNTGVPMTQSRPTIDPSKSNMFQKK